MNKRELDMFIGEDDLTVSEAMQKMNVNANGILFLTNREGILKGCITDGDIRRFLLSGGKMTDMAISAANLKPRYAKNVDGARRLFHAKYFYFIPIVDNEGKIVELYKGDGEKKQIREYTSLHLPVVINAGGKGTRLDPYTRVLPKPLIPVGDLPIIELIMREYQNYGCDSFHIIVNYKRDLMKAYFHDGEGSYKIFWHDEEMPLGTGGGLSLLKGIIKSTFFFANCDALLTADYADMVRFHKENKNVITMVCAYKNISIPYGVVEMGVNGSIIEMKEKPLVSFLTNTGIYIVEPEVIDDIEDNVSIGFPDIVEMEKSMGKKVAVYPINENDWMDMGQINELEKMRIKLYGE